MQQSGQTVPVALKLLQPVKPPGTATVSQLQMYQVSDVILYCNSDFTDYICFVLVWIWQVAQLWQRDRARLALFSINVHLYSQNHKVAFVDGLAQLVATLVRSTKLLYAGPGQYWDGWPYRGSTPGAGNLSLSNQPPRSTQPGHPFVGRCNEYRSTGSDALRMGSKGRYGVVCR